MSIDFRQLKAQVNEMGEGALAREKDRQAVQKHALGLLSDYANDLTSLGEKVNRAANMDQYLRCARPLSEPLNAIFSLPDSVPDVVIIAADGSQINPDRHAEVDYSLINVGAIQMVQGSSGAPKEYISTRLIVDDDLYTPQGTMTEGLLALRRDLAEREILFDLSSRVSGKTVITFTDGPIELWSRPEQVNTDEFKESFENYLKVLTGLRKLEVATAGYVDRPGANHVVRMLEVGLTPEDKLSELRTQTPLRGAADAYLFAKLLPPGSRSALFGLQTQTAEKYREDLSLHFFYINVGIERKAKIARVEIPAWVAADAKMLDSLHAVLVNQSKILGNRSYPYLLHRAHEAAVVTRQDREQVTQMIMLELRHRGLDVGELSEKQATKNLGGRNRFL